MEEPLADSKTIVCKLSEFDSQLRDIQFLENKNPYKLEKTLPSWDYYYNFCLKSWFKVVALNKTFTVNDKEFSIGEIDSILFENDDVAVVQMINGKTLKGKVNKKELNYNSNSRAEVMSTEFIKFNRELHGHQ